MSSSSTPSAGAVSLAGNASTVVIVGGGVAGLSAAVDLCDPLKYAKGAPRPKVILYELLPKVGGNVRSVSLEVEQTMSATPTTLRASYDTGALQAFSWYANLYDLARRVQVSPTLIRPFVIDPPLQFQTKPDVCQYLNEKDWIRRIIPAKEDVMLLASKGVDVLTCPKEALSFYQPVPSGYTTGASATTSLADFLGDTPRLRDLAGTNTTSYTYGNSTEITAYSLLSMQMRPSDNQSSCYGRIDQITEAMRAFVTTNGGQIITDRAVEGIYTATKQVVFAPTTPDPSLTLATLSSSSSLPVVPEPQSYDEVILASPLGTVKIDGVHIANQVSQVDIQSTSPQYRYTRYLSVCFQLNKLPSAADADATQPGTRDPRWTALFDIPSDQDNHGQPEVRSFLNLGLLPGLSGYVLAYVVVPESVDMPTLANDHDRLMQLVNKVAFFQEIRKTQDCFVEAVVYVEQFPHTMAVLNHAMRRWLQQNTGLNHIHFAGAWQAAFPGMEAACFSGRSVAARIQGTYDDYMTSMRKLDDQYVDKFRSGAQLLPSSVTATTDKVHGASDARVNPVGAAATTAAAASSSGHHHPCCCCCQQHRCKTC